MRQTKTAHYGAIAKKWTLFIHLMRRALLMRRPIRKSIFGALVRRNTYPHFFERAGRIWRIWRNRLFADSEAGRVFGGVGAGRESPIVRT